MSEPGGYAATFLREADKDRYFATLLLKPAERAAVPALYAFSSDVASVRGRAPPPQADSGASMIWSRNGMGRFIARRRGWVP